VLHHRGHAEVGWGAGQQSEVRMATTHCRLADLLDLERRVDSSGYLMHGASH
jgi:hypothetical protein